MAQGPRQPVAVHMAFDEVLTGAALKRLTRGPFIACRTEDDDHGVARGSRHPFEYLDTLGIRQRKVKQNHLNTATAQSFQRIGESRDRFDTKGVVARACQRPPDELDVSGIVLDEEDRRQWVGHGRWTFVGRPPRFGRSPKSL